MCIDYRQSALSDRCFPLLSVKMKYECNDVNLELESQA